MPKETRRSGLGLVLAGLVGIGFFWLTDPKWGLGSGAGATDIVDAINQASPGRWIGITGSGAVSIIGVWLMTRRSA